MWHGEHREEVTDFNDVEQGQQRWQVATDITCLCREQWQDIIYATYPFCLD